VLFGRSGTSLGVAVVVDSLAPSSGANSVVGLDEDGIIPGSDEGGGAVGDIHFRFVLPGTMTPAETDCVSFTIGDAGGDLDEFVIRAFDINDVEIHSENRAGASRFLVGLTIPGIHRIEIDFLGTFGYSLDDLGFDDPEAAECLIVIGSGIGSDLFHGIGHTWNTLLSDITYSRVVTLDDIPSFPIAIAPARRIRQLQPVPLSSIVVQYLLWNPTDFPANPEQYTQALRVTLWSDGRVTAASHGAPDGMHVTLETIMGPSGVLHVRFPFSIDGFEE
jgi:hypothetical protein